MNTHHVADTAEWGAIATHGRRSESESVRCLAGDVCLPDAARGRVLENARALVRGCRQRTRERPLLDLFLQEFGLSNDEGIALMCISEALLRIPDKVTAEALIAERIASANWARHIGQSDSLFLNASTWALLLTGKVLGPSGGLDERITRDVGAWLHRCTARLGESTARTAMSQAVRILGSEFVLGQTIEEALQRARQRTHLASFDMLGEGARTFADANRYYEAYIHAIRAIGRSSAHHDPLRSSGISVKLSALHPRFEPLQEKRVLAELSATLQDLAHEAATHNIHLTVDAEEAERLELTLRVFQGLTEARKLRGWEGLGIAVQAYSQRAGAVIDWLDSLRRPILVRLVKGAYWDHEIKRAQVEGIHGYPVYTRKVFTDLSYMACATRLFASAHLCPQFATHNAYTLAAVIEMGKASSKYWEFQRLHGMGQLLYDEARRQYPALPPVRVYAPVGEYKDLLAYLVRRLLENGANSSFVNRFMDAGVPVDELIVDPVARAQECDALPHPRIPLPRNLFGAARANSTGLDVGDRAAVQNLLNQAGQGREPLIPADDRADTGEASRKEHGEAGGRVTRAVRQAADAFPAWQARPAAERAESLMQLSDHIESSQARFVSLLCREAGKTLLDAVAEVREATDFCRYYAHECKRLFSESQRLPGPTGESNHLALCGRGVFACISPWNFPLAIFTGQVVAALAAGNAVVAKPAEQTPTIAAAAVELMHTADIPEDVVQLLLGDSHTGAALVAEAEVAGVAFTGSTVAAKSIQRSLAAREGAIIPLIAETGGQNAMVVDSTALLEQVVDDVVTSCFRSAGQRCSALRVLYVQEDVADNLIDMLIGAMDALVIGDPVNAETDVGPVIDAEALKRLESHVCAMSDEVLHRCSVPATLDGRYCAPTLIAVRGIADLTAEHFGPILHIARFRSDDLPRVLEDIRSAGYGLTLGIHTRIGSRAEAIMRAAPVGNTYVNRDMVGAVVGVQPFGGEGLSGTGPKAGGPFYLPRFAVERMVTWNTVATGGNAELLNLG